MALFKCPECGKGISDKAASCPNCGVPINKSKDFTFEEQEIPDIKNNNRRISVLLFLGIMFLPLVFAWFTLREGHTNRARLISFCWLALLYFPLFSAFYKMPSNQKDSNNANLNTSVNARNKIIIEFGEEKDWQKTGLKMTGISPGGSSFYFGETPIPSESFHIRNNNDFAIKDVEIACGSYTSSLYGPIDRKEFTIHAVIGPESSEYVPNFNFGFVDQQSRVLKCEISSFDR